MTTCKECGCEREINKHGYCESCNAAIRAEITKNIDTLNELAEEAAPFLPDEEKTDIHKRALAAYDVLRSYKAKKVPFFKSDIEILKTNVYKGLGMEAPPPVPSDGTAAANKKPYMRTALITSAIMIILIVAFSFYVTRPKPMTDKDKTSMIVTSVQTTVKEHLLSPTSAKFPLAFSEYAIKADPNLENVYTVTSYVDADNAFGASLRYIFSLKIEIHFDTKQYRVLDFAMD